MIVFYSGEVKAGMQLNINCTEREKDSTRWISISNELVGSSLLFCLLIVCLVTFHLPLSVTRCSVVVQGVVVQRATDVVVVVNCTLPGITTLSPTSLF